MAPSPSNRGVPTARPGTRVRLARPKTGSAVRQSSGGGQKIGQGIGDAEVSTTPQIASQSTSSPKPGPTTSPGSDPRRTTVSSRRPASVETPDGYIAVGQVMGAFGPLGDLRVQAFSDRPDRFKAVQRIFVGQALTPARILRRGVHGIGLTLRLDTVTTRERARALFGEYLYLPDAESIKLQPGEYFIHQLIGLTVADEAGTEIGRLTEVIQTGSNDVYVVNGPKGEILLPVIPDVIKNVDLDGRSMTVHLLPGLIDD